MAKLGLKEIFKKALSLVFDDRDDLTITDDFAKAAFRREGYAVIQRDHAEAVESSSDSILGLVKASYTLIGAKDGKEYSGTVHSGHFTSHMTAHGFAGTAHMRHCWITEIRFENVQ